MVRMCTFCRHLSQIGRLQWSRSDGLAITMWHRSGQSSVFGRTVVFAGNNQWREQSSLLAFPRRAPANLPRLAQTEILANLRRLAQTEIPACYAQHLFNLHWRFCCLMVSDSTICSNSTSILLVCVLSVITMADP
uniref:Uncharacterized protein n=1 Tax=Picea glauca TaxID=3330 RepID=A0A101LTL8_PICGL|nr:hypothetical protein ABT39_MTgene4041 [Picea glauca]